MRRFILLAAVLTMMVGVCVVTFTPSGSARSRPAADSLLGDALESGGHILPTRPPNPGASPTVTPSPTDPPAGSLMASSPPPSPPAPLLSASSLMVTPSAPLGQGVSASVSVTGKGTVQDVAISVRDAADIDNGDLDFPHFGPMTFDGPKTLAASVTEPAAGTYTVGIAYEINGSWVHLTDPTGGFEVTSGTPTPTPTPTSTSTSTSTSSPSQPPSESSPSSSGNPSGNPLGSTGARSGLPWNSGVFPMYRAGSASSFASALSYAESRRGRLADVNMAAQYDDSWASLVDPQILDFLDASPAVPVLMQPPFPAGGSWTAAASGAYDSYYRQLGANIVAKRPNAKTVLRFAWESNGNWYPWSASTAGGATAFVNGWRRAVDDMRAGAGTKASNIVFDYSLSGLDDYGAGDPLSVTYPGDQWVDIIGEDSYDDWQVTTSHTTPAKAADLQRIYDFAVSHGKWMSLDEWGLHHTNANVPEGKDNPAYIDAMMTWINTHSARLAYENYFQDDAMTNVNSALFSPKVDNNPQSTSAYLAAQR